jgi:hypothetical protein
MRRNERTRAFETLLPRVLFRLGLRANGQGRRREDKTQN